MNAIEQYVFGIGVIAIVLSLYRGVMWLDEHHKEIAPWVRSRNPWYLREQIRRHATDIFRTNGTKEEQEYRFFMGTLNGMEDPWEYAQQFTVDGGTLHIHIREEPSAAETDEMPPFWTQCSVKHCYKPQGHPGQHGWVDR